MNHSVFSAISAYLRSLFWGFHSLMQSLSSVIPYLYSKQNLKREITEQYPDPVSSKTEEDLPPRTRGLLFNDIEICTGCKACREVCPTDCFQIETENRSDSEKKWVSRFDIDLSRCIFCGYCVDVCEPASLIHTKKFESTVFEPNKLVVSFGRGSRWGSK